MNPRTLDAAWYRKFRRYILPKFEDTRIVDISLPLLEVFRSYLNTEMGLSLKSCRNVIDGTFWTMMRDARKHGTVKEIILQIWNGRG